MGCPPVEKEHVYCSDIKAKPEASPRLNLCLATPRSRFGTAGDEAGKEKENPGVLVGCLGATMGTPETAECSCPPEEIVGPEQDALTTPPSGLSSDRSSASRRPLLTAQFNESWYLSSAALRLRKLSSCRRAPVPSRASLRGSLSSKSGNVRGYRPYSG